jgi:hypothetical protein
MTTILTKVNFFRAVEFIPAKLVIVIVKQQHLVQYVRYSVLLLIPQQVIWVLGFLNKSTTPRVMSRLSHKRGIEPCSFFYRPIPMSCVCCFDLLVLNE